MIPWLLRFVPLALTAWLVGIWVGERSLLVVAAGGAIVGLAYVGAMVPLLRRPPLDVYAKAYLAKIPFLK